MRLLSNFTAMLLLIVVIFSLVACTEDEAQKKNEEMLVFTYESFTFMNSRENEIEETIVFINTKDELDVFCALHGQKIGDLFLMVAAKYDDSFFERNMLIWVNSGTNYRAKDIDLISIKRNSVDDSVWFSVNIHSKMLTGVYPDEYTGDVCFLVEIKGKQDMTKYNTTIERTEENVPVIE